MRSEELIRRARGKMKGSRYRSAYAVEIGVLNWVLGESDSIRAGVMSERGEDEIPDIHMNSPVKTGGRKWSQWGKVR